MFIFFLFVFFFLHTIVCKIQKDTHTQSAFHVSALHVREWVVSPPHPTLDMTLESPFS